MSSIPWTSVAAALRQIPEGAVLRVPKAKMEHPTAGGLRLAIAVPRGQLATYQRALPDSLSLWVRDFGTHYDAAVERQSKLEIGQAVDTSPIVAGAAVGSLVGALLGRTSAALFIGAAIGGALAAIGTANSNPAQMSDRADPLGTSQKSESL
jgi:hypothetical protein